MRIAIPQHQGLVSGAYELSKAVSIHDVDFQNMSISDGGLHDFPVVSESFDWMDEKGVQAVLVGTIDPDNAEILSNKGIHVFTGAGDMPPSETAEQFMHLMRAAMDRHAHGHQGGCCGGHGGGDEGGCCSDGDGECCGGENDEECCGGAGHGDEHECCGKHKH